MSAKPKPTPSRTTHEIQPFQWPLVSRQALSDLQLRGEASPEWNPLIHALAAGYVHLHNLEINLKAVVARSQREELKCRAERLLAEVIEMKAEYPIKLVG